MTGSVEHLLAHRCTVERALPGNDGQGGFTKTWTAVHTAVKCRRSSPRGAEESVADQDIGRVTDVFYFVAGIDIRPQDRITTFADERDTTSADVWEVQALMDPSLAHHSKVLTTKIERG